MEKVVKLLWGLGLQDSFSPIAYHISSFHDLAMIVVIFIISVIMYITLLTSTEKVIGRSMKSNETLETLWTVLPCAVLAALAAPSLVTLYMSEEAFDPTLSVKITGHQWYWSYEYGNSSTLSFDSYMTPTEDLKNGEFRLLECDYRTPIPMGVEVQLIITSSDVIHSWAIPSSGVKMDAVPGRLNQVVFFCTRPGVIYGQCSEICGSFHSFMPICLEIVPLEEFLSFYNLPR